MSGGIHSMNVLICNRHPHHSLGGSEIQCDLIAGYLHRRGHSVTYAALESEQNPRDVAYDTIAVPRVHLRSMMNVLRRDDPDLVYWRYNRNAFLRIALLCRATGRRCVFSVSSPKDVEAWSFFTEPAGPWWSPEGIQGLLRQRVQQVMSRTSYEGFRYFDGVITLSMNLLQRVPDEPFGPPQRAAIYNSMDHKSIAPFFWPRPYVAWVANLKQCKNPEHFLGLAHSLRDLPIDFLMAGAVQHEGYAFVEHRQQLPENVFYLGPRSIAEVNGLLRGALCMVHTCDPEGFGNNFIQAWFQKTPTVSLYFDPDELIETRRIGFCSRTPARFSAHVRRLYEEPRLRRQMGRRAREFAQRTFDPKTNLARYEEFFWRVLGDGDFGITPRQNPRSSRR